MLSPNKETNALYSYRYQENNEEYFITKVAKIKKKSKANL
jgi:hypothetical protein